MWIILLSGVVTHIFAKMKSIVDKTPEDINWNIVLKKFFSREWPSYCMSIIFTCIIAYSFHFMKTISASANEHIMQFSKWIPLSVLILYLVGVANQWLFYYILGTIQKKGQVNIDILTNKEKEI